MSYQITIEEDRLLAVHGETPIYNGDFNPPDISDDQRRLLEKRKQQLTQQESGTGKVRFCCLLRVGPSKQNGPWEVHMLKTRTLHQEIRHYSNAIHITSIDFGG